MKNFKINALAIVVSSFLSVSCGLDMREEYVGGTFERLVLKEQDWSDTVQVIDNLGIKDSYNERLYSHKPENFDFTASGNINEIYVHARIECTDDGGNMIIYCNNYQNNNVWFDGPEIVFNNLAGTKMTHKDGYTIRMLDSLKVGKKTYKDVLEFDASGAKKNKCNYDKFYIAATKGLLRIDLQDSIKIERK